MGTKAAERLGLPLYKNEGKPLNDSRDEKLRIREELKRLAENANRRAENEFLRIVMASIVESSPIIDKYSTWLLAGCGAMASIMIANVKAVIPFLGSLGFKISLYLLTISAIIGLLQKFRAMKVQSFSVITERLFTRAESIRQNHQQAFAELQKAATEHGVELEVGLDMNLQRIRSEMAAFTPFFLRTKTLAHFDKGAKDELHGWREAVGGLRWQIYFFGVQFLLFVGFLLVAAFSVKFV